MKIMLVILINSIRTATIHAQDHSYRSVANTSTHNFLIRMAEVVLGSAALYHDSSPWNPMLTSSNFKPRHSTRQLFW